MKTYSQFVAETDSRMYGDDSVLSGLSGKGKPKPFMGYEQVDSDPCWEGYRQDGMKNKGGRQVPNCVPMAEGSYFHSKSELLAAIRDSEQEIKSLQRKKAEAKKAGDTKALKQIDFEIAEMEENIADSEDQLKMQRSHNV